MRLYSASQARNLDEIASREHHIPSLLLMEHAGLQAALAAKECLGNPARKRLLVVCGTGNNGGDGLVAARILRDWGAEVSIFFVGDPLKFRGDAKINHEIIQAIPLPIVSGRQQFLESLATVDLIIDAIFGTGLSKPIEGEIQEIIQAMNQARKPVLSVDLPSGVDSDSGKVLGIAVQAACTITLGVAKVGLFLYPGREKVGKLQIGYLPIPAQAIDRSPFAAELLEERIVKNWLPAWPADAHKGKRGRAMILAGSRGYSGAAALAALGCLRSGAGLTYLAVPDGIRALMEHKLNEPVKVGIPQTPNWVFGKVSLPETKTWWEKADALAVGPGIGRDPETGEYVKSVISEYSGPLVVDADGLFFLEENFLKKHGRPGIILTPHEGEMARLCGISPEEVHENRCDLVKEKAKSWNVTLLLKGASTLLATPASFVWINPAANPGMAAGGSGDVLTGMIVSFLAQGLEPEKAAATAAFLHGRCGDILAQERGVRGVGPELLAESLYRVF